MRGAMSSQPVHTFFGAVDSDEAPCGSGSSIPKRGGRAFRDSFASLAGYLVERAGDALERRRRSCDEGDEDEDDNDERRRSKAKAKAKAKAVVDVARETGRGSTTRRTRRDPARPPPPSFPPSTAAAGDRGVPVDGSRAAARRVRRAGEKRRVLFKAAGFTKAATRSLGRAEDGSPRGCRSTRGGTAAGRGRRLLPSGGFGSRAACSEGRARTTGAGRRLVKRSRLRRTNARGTDRGRTFFQGMRAWCPGGRGSCEGDDDENGAGGR